MSRIILNQEPELKWSSCTWRKGLKGRVRFRHRITKKREKLAEWSEKIELIVLCLRRVPHSRRTVKLRSNFAIKLICCYRLKEKTSNKICVSTNYWRKDGNLITLVQFCKLLWSDTFLTCLPPHLCWSSIAHRSNLACHLFLHSLCLKKGFIFSDGWEKPKTRILLCDSWKLCEI